METEKNQNREGVIVRTSIIGIVANMILAGFKAFVGLMSNSIAVILDAVNNLSDAMSSIITIIGTKLAGKKPDKKHPFGYGRIEYMSSVVVAAIVLYAGLTSLTESVKKIISPETADYSITSLIIIGSAVVVKLLLGLYVRKKGAEVNSGSLTASGSDAMFDAVLSASVLGSAIIYMVCGVSLEAYVGVIISAIIIKSGIEMIKEAVDEMIGTRVNGEISKKIKRTVLENENVKGVYDLVLNNYGPDKYMGSVHVEILDTMTAKEIDFMTREIQNTVYRQHGVIMTGIGIYAISTNGDESDIIRQTVRKLVLAHNEIIQFHGFYADIDKHFMTFDIIIAFDAQNRNEIIDQVYAEIKEIYPNYTTHITLDFDYSD